MQVAWRRSIVGVVIGIVLLSVVAVLISPYVSSPPTHLLGKRIASHQMGQFAVLSATAGTVQTIAAAPSAVLQAKLLASTASILQMTCVRIC